MGFAAFCPTATTPPRTVIKRIRIFVRPIGFAQFFPRRLRHREHLWISVLSIVVLLFFRCCRYCRYSLSLGHWGWPHQAGFTFGGAYVWQRHSNADGKGARAENHRHRHSARARRGHRERFGLGIYDYMCDAYLGGLSPVLRPGV